MIRWQWTAKTALFFAAILAIAWLSESLFADAALEYPRPCPGGCVPNVKNFGYNKTNWRRWPGEPQIDETNPRAVTSEPIPTPEGQKDNPLRQVVPSQPYQQPTPQPLRTRAPQEESPPPSSLGPVTIPTPEGKLPCPCPNGSVLPPETGTILPPETGTILPPDGGTIRSPAGVVTPPEGKKPETKPDTKPSKPLIEEGDFPGMPEDVTPPKSSTPSKNKSSDAMPIPQDSPKQAAAAATLRSKGVARNADWSSLAGNKSPQRGVAPIRVYRADSIGVETNSSANRIQATGYAATDAPAKADPIDQRTVWTVGLNGYCPVELGRGGRWVLGDLRWTVVYQGCIYRLSGAAQRQQFLANPDRYAPINSGNDVVLQAAQSCVVPGKAAHCAIYRDRLYMFSSEETRLEFNKHPERYVAGK
jgi:YHS domain-containing protein